MGREAGTEMARRGSQSVTATAIIFATLVAPTAVRAEDPPAEPVEGTEAQPAEAAVPADDRAPVPSTSAEAAPAAPAPPVETQAVTPAPPPADRDIMATQDIAALREL